MLPARTPCDPSSPGTSDSSATYDSGYAASRILANRCRFHSGALHPVTEDSP